MSLSNLLKSFSFSGTKPQEQRKRGRKALLPAALSAVQVLERRLLLSASPSVSVSNSTPNVGDNISMSFSPNDDLGDSDVGSWSAGWGDGTTDNLDFEDNQGDSHTYTTDGHFNVTGSFQSIADSGSGGYYSGFAPIDVADPNYSSPTVSASLDTATPYVNFPVTIDASAVFDYTSDSISHYVDHFTVDWGDSHVDNMGNGGWSNSTTTVPLQHTYTSAGTYSVSLTETDEWATSGSSTPISVVVATPSHIAPTVTLSAGTQHPVVNQSASISGVATYWTYDPAPNVDHFTITWGDGSSPQTVTTSANSGTFSHTYSTVGTYSVTATATDATLTSSASSALTVVVQPAPTEPAGANFDGGGVDLYSGRLDPAIDGLSSAGFSIPIDSSAAWSNADVTDSIDGASGNNTVRNDFPMIVAGANGVLIGQNGVNQEWFDPTSMPSPTSWVDHYDGQDTSQSDSVEWRTRFQGTRYESSGGFNIMGARLQSVALGRWLQEDPSGYANGGDLYSAFAENPIRFGDASGLQAALFNEPITGADYTKDPTLQWDWDYQIRYHLDAGLAAYYSVQHVSEYGEFSTVLGGAPVAFYELSVWDVGHPQWNDKVTSFVIQDGIKSDIANAVDLVNAELLQRGGGQRVAEVNLVSQYYSAFCTKVQVGMVGSPLLEDIKPADEYKMLNKHENLYMLNPNVNLINEAPVNNGAIDRINIPDDSKSARVSIAHTDAVQEYTVDNNKSEWTGGGAVMFGGNAALLLNLEVGRAAFHGYVFGITDLPTMLYSLIDKAQTWTSFALPNIK